LRLRIQEGGRDGNLDDCARRKMYQGFYAKSNWWRWACFCKIFGTERRQIWSTNFTSNGPCVGFQVSTGSWFAHNTFSQSLGGATWLWFTWEYGFLCMHVEEIQP
jgi:hypothetical protein